MPRRPEGALVARADLLIYMADPPADDKALFQESLRISALLAERIQEAVRAIKADLPGGCTLEVHV